MSGRAGNGASQSVVFNNRATLTISPEKQRGIWDTRNLGSGQGSDIRNQNTVLTGKTNRT